MLFVHLKHEVFERCLWLSILLAWLRTAVNSAVNFTGWPLRHRLNNRRKLVHISQLLIFSNFEEGLLILVLKWDGLHFFPLNSRRQNKGLTLDIWRGQALDNDALPRDLVNFWRRPLTWLSTLTVIREAAEILQELVLFLHLLTRPDLFEHCARIILIEVRLHILVVQFIEWALPLLVRNWQLLTSRARSPNWECVPWLLWLSENFPLHYFTQIFN